MAQKNFMYAMYEAVQHEMRQHKDMTWLFELTPAVASNPGTAVINLEKEFGRTRVFNTGIDEMWMAGATLGAGLVGSPSITLTRWECRPVLRPFQKGLFTERARKVGRWLMIRSHIMMALSPESTPT